MKRKVFVFLLAAVFCINSMTVFAEGEDMEHEGSTETEEIKEPAQMPHTKEEESFDTSEALTSLKERLPEIGGGVNKKEILRTEKTTPSNFKEIIKASHRKSTEGQTDLDVSQGNIRITASGAKGGGLDEDETTLNPNGYHITGTTTQYNIIVEKDVTAQLTLDNVNITCSLSNHDCLNVSHADVIVTLVGNNALTSNAGTNDNVTSADAGNAVAKDGMDGALTIQCEYADEKGHKCSKEKCGSLLAKGNPKLYHAGGLGSTFRNTAKKGESGFSNLTIKGGNIEASAGGDSPGIGAACVAEAWGGGYTKDIYITGGNVKAIGTESGSGIGSGYGSKVDGVYISGGIVEAVGGLYAPGIGASRTYPGSSQITTNIKISGGDTVVTAVGDKATNMPGIGSGGGNDKVSNVIASPDKGYQGYIQDGTSLTDYSFTAGTPFSSDTDIVVGKFYTKVYFGPFRDVNGIEDTTKEQIGANHVISKTGGEAFSKEQITYLTKVTGKQQNGTDFPEGELTLADPAQLEAVNEAKTSGKTGEFPITYTTPNGTTATISVFLRDDGNDANELRPEKPAPMLGANDFIKETGGNAFTEEELKNFGQIKAKDKEGNNVDLKEFKVDQEHFKKINEAKTKGKAGVFELSYEAPDGSKVTVNVTLVGEYDEITEDPDSREIIKGKHIISKTGGEGFDEEQLKELSKVKAADENENEIPKEQLVFPDPGQIQVINQAKTAGNVGDYPLTFQTPNGTQVTIQVFLRKEGSDGTKYSPENPTSSIGANDARHPTGGLAFTTDELIGLCKAKSKDSQGDNAELKVNREQFDLINSAKTAGKTGIFPLTFSMRDGREVSVFITLTGWHNVTFDSKGGDYTPETQTVEGGQKAVVPEEPKKKGYNFAGWYYTDNDGKKSKWDFETPIHEDIELEAEWTRIPDTEKKDNTKTSSVEKKTTQKKLPDWEYKKRIRKSVRTAKTSDKAEGIPETLALIGISAAVNIFLLCRRSLKEE